MKGIIETSIYLIIFALVCFFSIDFIRINQRVSDAGEISQYVENYIEAYCGDVPDKELSMQLRNEKLDMLSRSVQEGGMKLTKYLASPLYVRCDEYPNIAADNEYSSVYSIYS